MIFVVFFGLSGKVIIEGPNTCMKPHLKCYWQNLKTCLCNMWLRDNLNITLNRSPSNLVTVKRFLHKIYATVNNSHKTSKPKLRRGSTTRGGRFYKDKEKLYSPIGHYKTPHGLKQPIFSPRTELLLGDYCVVWSWPSIGSHCIFIIYVALKKKHNFLKLQHTK